MLFTETFNDEAQPSWIYGIVDALEYFGGAPRVLVMDNAAPLVRVPNWQEAEIQYAIRSLCTYYGMQPWACKPRTPKQKTIMTSGTRSSIVPISTKLVAIFNNLEL